MSINLQGTAEAALSVFGGLVSEMSPADLPEGASPANNDCVFAPGSVASRSGLSRVFGTPFPAGGVSGQVPTVTYGKSYVTPTGDIQNLYLDSNGALWMEDVSNSPGTYSQIGSVTAGSYAKSVTAFGREYIAVSDGLHGTDIAYQWDGTYLDRVTMDGPGTAPTVSSVALPSVSMATVGSITLTLSESDPANLSGGVYTQINTWTGTSVAGINVGDSLTISGYTGSSAPMNGTWSIVGIFGGGAGGYATLIQLAANLPSTTVYSTAAASGVTSTGAMQRQNNVVTVNTATAHQLQVGYQALIAGVPANTFGAGGWANGGSLTSIVINNSNLPGIATVTVSLPSGTTTHGLTPGCFITLTGVTHTLVGTSLTSVSWAGGVATATTSAAHNLSPGASVTISGTSAAYDGTFTVANIVSSTVFTFLFTPLSGSAFSGSASVYLNWPIPDTPEPTYFEVVSAPSGTTFQIQVSYTDGTWSSGTIKFAWNGTFFVTSVPSSTQFQYQQYGPNATSNTTSGPSVTPWGQAAPGIHQCQVMFLTRQGYITKPSPPVTFTANGGQYVSVSQIPIGPSNVIARILAFTGAGGEYFFYIPTAAVVSGNVVSTATQINDNTSTFALLDFSDNTLFASIGISIPGNDLANQIVIDGALGFGYYASRLITWGQRNRIQNLLNPGFDGGFVPASITTLTAGMSSSATTASVTNGNSIANGAYIQIGNELMLVTGGGGTTTLTVTRYVLGSVKFYPSTHSTGDPVFVSPFPTGWTAASGGAGGILCVGHYGNGWEINGSGSISQSFYDDSYGAPISTPNTYYTARACLKGSGSSVVVTISSASTGFSSSATLTATSSGVFQYSESGFSEAMPNTIPTDMVLSISQGSGTTILDELSIIYTESPYLDQIMYGSYANNPEAFDGVTGKFGAAQDSHKVMESGIIRQTFYILTQEPSGRLHQTNDNGVTEPSGWQVNEVASNCGVLSAFALTKSQSDDSSASGGEEWMAWASSTGARIFGGDEPFKISQEIQPNWVGASSAGASSWSTATGINPAYNKTAWALNDPVDRVIYFGMPLSASVQGAPNAVFYMNYRELDTASQIASGTPIHTGLSGKLICTDHTRKWSPWKMTMNGASLMYRQPGQLSVVLLGGNGKYPGSAAGYGNVYTLSSSKLTDDDYRAISPSYTTYFFVSREQESQLSYVDAKGQRMPLGGGRKMLSYVTAYIAGVGNIVLTYLCNSLTNPWALTTSRSLSTSPTIDLECGGGSAQSNRIAIQFAPQPLTGSTDVSFNLQKVLVGMKVAGHLPIRGSAQ